MKSSKGINIALTPFQILIVALIFLVTITFVMYARGGIDSLLAQVDLFIDQISGV
mgnify:CR=1 FL=1|jgi:hypothetical protein